jgi:hypothetical protein
VERDRIFSYSSSSSKRRAPRKALNHSCHPFNPHFEALDIERPTVTLFPYKILQTKLVVVRLIEGALLPFAGYNRTICLEESVHWL